MAPFISLVSGLRTTTVLVPLSPSIYMQDSKIFSIKSQSDQIKWSKSDPVLLNDLVTSTNNFKKFYEFPLTSVY